MANGKADKLVASPNTRVQQGFSDVVTEADNLSPSQAAKIAESGFKAKPIAGAGPVSYTHLTLPTILRV